MSFKEQLKSEILPKAVEYYNSGLDINSSIVKAAQDFKLNLDQTDRLMETMNTARVIAHYEKNAEDRTANCDIADKDAIRKMLYGDKPQEKAAGVDTASKFGDYSMYMEAELDYRGRMKLAKAASAEPEKPARKTEFTIKQAADHVMDYARKLENERRFAEERVEMAKGVIATNLSKIAHSLSKGYEPERRYALFKTACAGKCPNVVKSVDSEMHPQIVKEAALHLSALSRANVIDTAPVDAEVALARDIEDDLVGVSRMETKVALAKAAEAEVKKLIEKYAKVVKVAYPGNPKPPSPDKNEDSGKDKKDDKKSDPWFGSAKKVYENAVPDASPGVKAVYDYLKGGAMSPDKIDEAITAPKKKDTGLKDYVDNLVRSSIITELYNDDDIIKEANPEDVQRAYATMVQASPEASMNKEVVRAFLRQAVNSVAVSSFDAKQLADLDTTLLKNRGTKVASFNDDGFPVKTGRRL